jgi:hypothetical protein
MKLNLSVYILYHVLKLSRTLTYDYDYYVLLYGWLGDRINYKVEAPLAVLYT